MFGLFSGNMIGFSFLDKGDEDMALFDGGTVTLECVNNLSTVSVELTLKGVPITVPVNYILYFTYPEWNGAFYMPDIYDQSTLLGTFISLSDGRIHIMKYDPLNLYPIAIYTNMSGQFTAHVMLPTGGEITSQTTQLNSEPS